MVEIKGTVERIVFHNDENGYTIARLDAKGSAVTIVGVLPEVQPGVTLSVEGDWTTHPKYGRQFKVERCEQSLPTTAAGIEAYLGSSLIRGVGPIGAGQIVRQFGADTLRVLDEEPERLEQVPGIGPSKAAAIIESWQKQKHVQEVMMFLQGHGVTTGLAVKICQTYGSDALSVVQENPYRMVRDIQGVGFVKADQIARNLGLAVDSPFRVQAGVLHTLREQTRNGNVFSPLATVVTEASRLLNVSAALVREAIKSLDVAGDIHCENVSGEPAVYLASFCEAEVSVASHLQALVKDGVPVDDRTLNKVLRRVTRKAKIKLSPDQREAVRMALTSKVTVLTGGPGTGKTETTRTIIRALDALNLRCALCAPTGRAAKRLSEATGRSAKTIHRLLEYNPERGFARDEDDPLSVDYLIVDEASMLDLKLTDHLLRALKPTTQVLFVGDVDQLSSVGAGDVLRDIIASGRAAVARLNTIFRQATNSGIVVNAHRINRGQFPVLNEFDDFYFFSQQDPRQAAELLVDVVGRRIPKKFGLYAIDDVQVLTPMYRGACGVNNLNALLQEALNPAKPGKAEQKLGDCVFRVGDKVMQVRNNYDKMVFNGDIGRIVTIDPVLKEIAVRIARYGLAYYDWDEASKELTHAFAVSIHKAQGAEYPAIVMPVLSQHYVMLQRNLLYTAITRARRLVVLVGTRQAIKIAVNNDQVRERRSGLGHRLKAAAEQVTRAGDISPAWQLFSIDFARGWQEHGEFPFPVLFFVYLAFVPYSSIP